MEHKLFDYIFGRKLACCGSVCGWYDKLIASRGNNKTNVEHVKRKMVRKFSSPRQFIIFDMDAMESLKHVIKGRYRSGDMKFKFQITT